jgi:hypothetical protein
MNWLKKIIKQHNEKLTYADYEEHWTVSGWLCSLITLTALSTIPFFIISVQKGQPLIGLFGSCFGALIVWWHFWHIMH